jgi:KDO2-lipid IV(A) lauroyltransferase
LRFTALFPLSVARALGRGAGAWLWLVNSKARRITEINLALAFPDMAEDERRDLAKASVCSTGELMAEMGHIWVRPPAYFRSLVLAVNGAEVVTDALQQGRGVIALGPHLGNWEALGLHMAELGELVVLYEPPRIAALDPLIQRVRGRTGGSIVPTTQRGIATLVRTVRRGAISGILPDQVPGELGAGRNSEFFGVPCFTGTLATNLIRRSGALAVFVYARRIPGGFELNYIPAAESIYSEDLDESLTALNRGVEDCVMQCVDQYQWEYRRFRQRPKRAGENPYAGL